MSIVVIGVNHRTGPLELLERLAIPAADQAKALTGLTARESIREAVVLSTCNRTEVYAVAERFHGAYADIRDFFCDVAGLDPNDLQSHLYSQHDDAAVTHLFEVAAGLDSAVLGESEILGQVRSAWELAQVEGAAKATLNLLFRHAIETGKRARTDTAIGRGTASVSHAAVEMAEELLGTLQGRPRPCKPSRRAIGTAMANLLRCATASQTSANSATPTSPTSRPLVLARHL